MIVSMWMTRDVATVNSAVPISAALALMARRHVRRLPVLETPDGETRLVGMVTATDIRNAYPRNVNPFAVAPGEALEVSTTVGEIMNRNVIATAPDAPIEDAAAEMRDRKIGGLPVLRNTELVGLITESDIFRAFVAVMRPPERGARITFDASRHDDLFGLVADVARTHDVRVLSLISAEQQDRPVCVVRVAGPGVEAMLDKLWSSGHPVLNVLRLP